MHKPFAPEHIKPNPFRRMELYPVDRIKVEALKASYRRTGFWENLLAREVGNGDAGVAYGHHRLIAFEEE